VTLLDYTPYGDAAYTSCDPAHPWICTVHSTSGDANIGGADFLYGAGGNDAVYGETGGDTIFGGAQDDTLYGNSGSDWISGGTGDDGVLGDDGLLLVSRNGYAEPLYGLAATTQLILGGEEHGDEHDGNTAVTVNVTGSLAYTADRAAFLGRAATTLIYGGLGNDFLHGRRWRRRDLRRRGAAGLLRERRDPLAFLAANYVAGQRA